MKGKILSINEMEASNFLTYFHYQCFAFKKSQYCSLNFPTLTFN